MRVVSGRARGGIYLFECLQHFLGVVLLAETLDGGQHLSTISLLDSCCKARQARQLMTLNGIHRVLQETIDSRICILSDPRGSS